MISLGNKSPQVLDAFQPLLDKLVSETKSGDIMIQLNALELLSKVKFIALLKT